MGAVKSCLGLKKFPEEKIESKSNGNSIIKRDDDVLDVTRASRENLVDDSTTEEQKAKPKELNRSKTIQNAIERQELLEKTFKNEEASESGSV